MGSSMSQTGSKANPELQQYVENEIQKHQVLIWSKTYCGYCGMTKKLFSNPEFKDVTVKIHELDKMESGSAIQKTLASMTGQRTVPSVWVNGKFIGGNDDTQNAYKRGKLLPMLGLSSSKL